MGIILSVSAKKESEEELDFENNSENNPISILSETI
jgi:hypothetical protein